MVLLYAITVVLFSLDIRTRTQLLQLCPLSSCVDQEDRAVWRQSRLAAYARAVSARDQAKARYDVAASAYSAAQQRLQSAEAQARKGSKPKPKAKVMEPPSERSGSAWTRAVTPPPKDEGIGGFLHGALDLVGMIPIIGEPADLLNAGIYAAEGDLVNAGISAASAIPLVGNVVGVGKLAVKYGGDVVDLARTAAKTGDEVAGAAAKAPEAGRAVSSATQQDFLYMYTGPAQLTKMGQSGTASRYLTPNGNLTPLQAQIELALPWYNPGTTVMKVPRAAVDSSVVLERRVTGNVFGRGGGGMEVVLDQRPPLAWFELVR